VACSVVVVPASNVVWLCWLTSVPYALGFPTRIGFDTVIVYATSWNAVTEFRSAMTAWIVREMPGEPGGCGPGNERRHERRDGNYSNDETPDHVLPQWIPRNRQVLTIDR
jgi:hypothetical protein